MTLHPTPHRAERQKPAAQFRHFMAHIGILNGITIAHTGKYPMVFNLSNWKSGKFEGKLYDD